MKIVQKILLACCGLFLAACQSPATQQTTTTTETTAAKINVITTFYPVYYMTKEIAGETANVSMLLDGSVDAHDFEPSAKEIAAINEADLFVYNNEFMETWVQNVVDSLGTDKKVTIVEAAENVTFIEGGTHTHAHEDGTVETHEDGVDPHVWLDPVLAKEQVNTIASALIAKNPSAKETYEKNRDALVLKLDNIAKTYKTTFENATNKYFVTQHEAFGYLAHRYELVQIAISGLQESEPSAQDIAEVIEEITAHNLNVIYVDPSSSRKAADTVASTTGAKVLYLYTMEQAVEGMDYLQLLEENGKSLVESIK